jgi:hypothetical protein
VTYKACLRYAVALSVAVVMALAVLSGNAVADSAERLVVEPDEVEAGRTYAEWSAAWEQWADSLPSTASPLFDTADCSAGQSGPVFFLAAKVCAFSTPCSFTVTRNCSVPAGKALYFPIIGANDSVAEEGVAPSFGPIIANIRAGLAGVVDTATGVEVDLDSGHLPAFRIQSVVYDFTLPQNNLYQAIGENIPAGTYSVAMDDGYYLMLKPPAKGNHKLHFTGTVGSFTLDITYHLKVE